MPLCTNCRALFDPTTGSGSLCPRCAAPKAAAPGSGVLRWVLLGGLGLLALVVLLSESGAVAADTTETKWASEGKYETESSWAGFGKPTLLRGVKPTPNVVVSVPRGAGHDVATEAAAAIKKAAPGGGGEGQSKLEITIAQLTPDGATWVPFHKSGSCKFSATYVLTAETPWSMFAARGQVSGEVTQTMTGLCSAALFREKMAQAVAAAILSEVGKLIAKNS